MITKFVELFDSRQRLLVKDLDILLQKYKGASEIECEQLSDGECLAEEPYDPVDFPNKANT
jgi:hypothetical protein